MPYDAAFDNCKPDYFMCEKVNYEHAVQNGICKVPKMVDVTIRGGPRTDRIMQIFVRTPEGKVILLNALAFDTVGNGKTKIQDKVGFPLAEFRFGG